MKIYFPILFSLKEPLQRLVGEKNAQMGITRLFEMCQEKKLNKHLIYVSISWQNQKKFNLKTFGIIQMCFPVT